MHGADDRDSQLLRALASPCTYPGHPEVTVHETHASWVFVAGDRVYKVKKPLALGFLDYSTLALRRAACREEVRVNRPLAPGIYLGVRAIVRRSRSSGPARARALGSYRLVREDAPGALEYAVTMRRFDERDTLAGVIATGGLTREHVAAVARRLAEFHRGAPVVEGWGPERVLAMWRANIDELRGVAHPAWRIDVLDAFGDAFTARHALELRRRGLAGVARDGHGDLRCEHILLGSVARDGPTVRDGSTVRDGPIAPGGSTAAAPTRAAQDVRVVDRIEFDPELRRIDAACDIAFLAMDLQALGQVWAARELYAAYRHAEGLNLGSAQLRSFYAAHWALVRAKVALIAAAGQAGGSREHETQVGQLERRHAQELWSLAERLCWGARAPVALVICGPAASGKSTLAAELARRSGMAVVSSDRARKRLAGLADMRARARPEHYTAHFTRATYERLADDALAALREGDGVIVDATCRSREVRALLLDRLHRVGMARVVVRCDVPLEVAVERAARRMGDPARVSDATPEIVAEQFRAWEELDELAPAEVLRLDTHGTAAVRPLGDQVAEVALAVDRRGRVAVG